MSAFDPLTLAGIVARWAVEKPDFTVLTVEGAGVRDDGGPVQLRPGP